MTKERNRKIAELWELGRTSGEIARELAISRNIVMGVIHRFRANGENISRRIEMKIVIEPPEEEVEPVVKQSNKPDRPPKIRALPLPEEPPAPPMTGGNCTFMGLTYRSCRYIIGPVKGLDTIYCGEPKAGRSFCKEHETACYIYAKPLAVKSAASTGDAQGKGSGPHPD
jgi:hypothetical protein